MFMKLCGGPRAMSSATHDHSPPFSFEQGSWINPEIHWVCYWLDRELQWSMYRHPSVQYRLMPPHLSFWRFLGIQTKTFMLARRALYHQAICLVWMGKPFPSFPASLYIFKRFLLIVLANKMKTNVKSSRLIVFITKQFFPLKLMCSSASSTSPEPACSQWLKLFM